MTVIIQSEFYRGKEMATRRDEAPSKLKATSVRSASGTRTEMLPADPFAVAKILAERRAKKSPAKRVKERLEADIAKRVGRKSVV